MPLLSVIRVEPGQAGAPDGKTAKEKPLDKV
jgi:hypothetical protein